MSVFDPVVVPFAAFVAYRERRNHAAAVLARGNQIDIGLTVPASAQDQPSVAAGADGAARDDSGCVDSDSATPCCSAATGPLSGIPRAVGVVVATAETAEMGHCS